MNEIKQEWLNRPVDDVLNSISLLIDEIYECDDYSVLGVTDPLRQVFLSMLPNRLMTALISYLDQTDKTYLHMDSIGFPDVWFELALNQDSRKGLVARLANINFDSYVFTFLNGIDEGSGTAGENAIRGILDEFGYPVPRDTSLDWSPCGIYRRVTKRELVWLLEDPIANFSRIIDSLFCSNAEYWDYLVDHVIGHLLNIPPDTLVTLLINDMHRRQEAYPVPWDYTSIWLSIANAEEVVDALVNQLACLPLDSCVIAYLNAAYAQEIAEESENPHPLLVSPLLVSLRHVLERANVFTGQLPRVSQ